MGSVLQSYRRQQETALSFCTTGVGLCLGQRAIFTQSRSPFKVEPEGKSLSAFPAGEAEVCSEAWSLLPMEMSLAEMVCLQRRWG